jgi:hypothetical protein
MEASTLAPPELDEGGAPPELPEHVDLPETEEGEPPAPILTLTLHFVGGPEMESADIWKRAHELIQSADSKGLRLADGTVSDYAALDLED